MKSTALYRAVMVALEARRLELGIAMATVDDMAGTPDRYYAKAIYPDTPSGRCAQWPNLQLLVEALFGPSFHVEIIAAEGSKPNMLGIDKGQSSKYLKIRHWRHRQHFQTMGKVGGRNRIANLAQSGKLSAAQRKAAKARWKKARAAKRRGAAHRARNAAGPS